MSATFRIFLVLMEFNFIFAAYPPIDKCKLSDSDCLKQSSQKALKEFTAGVPELGTEVLDIMHIDSIKFELAGLKLSLKDSSLKGLKNAVINKLSFNSKKKVLNINCLFDNLGLKGQYVASGRLLILPITGDGIMNLKIKNMILDVNMPYEIKQDKNGKDVIDLQSFKFKFDVKDSVHFHLTNLFNGNKQLSDAMHQFMNENWKQIAEEFGRPIIDATLKQIFESIKLFLNQQPLEDITLT